MPKTKKGGIKNIISQTSQKRLVYPGLFYTTLAFSVLTITAAFLINKQLPPQIPLYYGLAEGEDQLAPSILLVFPGVLGLIILLLNTAISFLTKELFYKKVLLVSAFAANVLVIITTIKIAFLIGNI